MPTINPTRFLHNLTELAEIGRVPDADGGGRDRRPFSAAEREARRYFSAQAEAAGLTVRTDGAANLSARLACAEADAPTLLLGSHLDTVPHGGPYDGALGVMAALEVLRVVQENRLPLTWHLEAIAFTDEEGRLGGFFGSRAASGDHDHASIVAFLDAAAAHPADLTAMRTLVPGSLEPEAVLAARRSGDELAGFIEIHIEQGPQLEHKGIPIGVVTGIAGRRSMQIVFHGRSDHAGTTPLDLRADALLAAARFMVGARELAHRDYPGAVFTCGNVEVKPGVYNVVPNEAVVWVEFRSDDNDALAGIDAAVRALAVALTGAPDLGCEFRIGEGQAPVALDPTMQNAIRRAADALDYAHMDLPSGALHDAQLMAAVTRTGMILVPSIGGRSHSPAEMTAPGDLVAGANVLLQTVLILAENAEQKP